MKTRVSETKMGKRVKMGLRVRVKVRVRVRSRIRDRYRYRLFYFDTERVNINGIINGLNKIQNYNVDCMLAGITVLILYNNYSKYKSHQVKISYP